MRCDMPGSTPGLDIQPVGSIDAHGRWDFMQCNLAARKYTGVHACAMIWPAILGRQEKDV